MLLFQVKVALNINNNNKLLKEMHNMPKEKKQVDTATYSSFSNNTGFTKSHQETTRDFHFSYSLKQFVANLV